MRRAFLVILAFLPLAANTGCFHRRDRVERVRLAARPGSTARGVLRRVVLDPGHGGRDSGAIGRRRTYEKTVNLDVAQRLARHLTRRGIEVVMSRTSDRFVSLAERSRLANRSGADLFVSIHANAARRGRTASGVEVFVLTPSVTDAKRAAAAARRYNPADWLPGACVAVSSAARGAVFRALMGEYRREAKRLARLVHAELDRVTPARGRGVKTANFAVLRETYRPAVLVELGFLSNSREEKLLASRRYRERLAAALARALARYGTGEGR